jgi:PAS domain S-box-containing protein
LHYQELFEFAIDGQVVTDLQGVIIEANHAAASLFRCRKEFLIGKPLGLLISDGLRGRFYEMLARLAHLDESGDFDTRVGRGGDVRDVRVRITPAGFSHFDGKRLHWTLRDMTEYQRAEAARQELLNRLVTFQEDERRRIAREIHDHLGQELTGLTLGLKFLEADLREGTAGRRRLRDLQEAVDRLGRESHEMALQLHPTVLDDLGLRPALDNLVYRWTERVGVPVDFHVGWEGTRRFPADIETTVYRVVQEALTNIARHATASRVSLIVEYVDAQLLVIAEDNGCGFDADATDRKGRLGLAGMRERIAMVGGSLHIESSPGVGTTVRARISCPERPGGRRV